MFDTHCHLNFSAFNKNLEEVVQSASTAGVTHIVVPGTDVKTSKRAVWIADKFNNVYAAVGIHPHHIFKMMRLMTKTGGIPTARREESTGRNVVWNRIRPIKEIEKLLKNKKVVAVGEVGIDKHYYQKTKYRDYSINTEFIDLQKEFLKEQIDLAIKFNKSLILHNRETKGDLLKVFLEVWSKKLEGKVVFHCCEPDKKLLDFAKEHKVFIGVDGDVTYWKKKQDFVKKIPLDLLVLETDSPYLLPEPLRSGKQFPNKPENLSIIARFVSNLMSIPIQQLIGTTTENSLNLFNIQ